VWGFDGFFFGICFVGSIGIGKYWRWRGSKEGLFEDWRKRMFEKIRTGAFEVKKAKVVVK